MDVTAAASSAIQRAAEQSSGATTAATPSAPSEDAVARFQDALGGPADQPASPDAQAQPETAPAEAPGPELVAPEAPPGPGDAILKGLERLSQGTEQAVQQASTAVNSVKPGEMMSAGDLMKMQMSLMQVSVQQDVVGKVAGKATQNIDSFLKNQ